MKKIDRSKFVSFIKEWHSAIRIISACICTIAIYNIFFMFSYIPSESMENTLQVTDVVLATRIGNKYERGDIAIFRNDEIAEGRYIIKRIVAVGGDEVDIVGDKLYINGSLVSEEYIKEPMENDVEYHLTVPDGCYFMLGDNRNDSFDCRFIKNKFIEEDDLVAKVQFVMFPFKLLN